MYWAFQNNLSKPALNEFPVRFVYLTVRFLREPICYILKEAFATFRVRIQTFSILLQTRKVSGKAARCHQQNEGQPCSRNVPGSEAWQ